MSRLKFTFSFIFLFLYTLTIHAYEIESLLSSSHSETQISEELNPVFQNEEISKKDPAVPVAVHFEQAPLTLDEVESLNEPFDNPLILTDDPLERFNRVTFYFVDKAIRWVITPFGKVYQKVIPIKVRKGVRNFAHHLASPTRVIAHLVTGHPGLSKLELQRFFINSIFGFGFWDVASREGYKKTNIDLATAFAARGMAAGPYLVLAGPTNIRGTIGLGLGYFVGLKKHLSLGPQSLVRYANLESSFNAFETLSNTETDTYHALKELWTLIREAQIQIAKHQTLKSLNQPEPITLYDPRPDLGVFYNNTKDPKFYKKAQHKKIKLKEEGLRRKLPFDFYENSQSTKLAFMLPGLGAPRDNKSNLMLTELLWSQGYNVVTINSPFEPGFLEFSKHSLPGNPVTDAKDIHLAFKMILENLLDSEGLSFSEKIIVGYSMGARYSIAVKDLDDSLSLSEKLQISKVIAINPPIDLFYAMRQLDNAYRAYPDPGKKLKELAPRIGLFVENLIGANVSYFDLSQGIPIDSDETLFLISYIFRRTLKDIIYFSQRRENLNVLESPIKKYKRSGVYQEISRYSFLKYFQEFVIPYYKDNRALSAESLVQNIHLQAHSDLLVRGPVYMIHNRDDFLINQVDLDWLIDLMKNRITVFEVGGHTGNMHTEALQNQIINYLKL